jgi:putative ABC transport system permease protein
LLAIALRALRSRRTQAGTLLAIAVLVATAAFAAPLFVFAAIQTIAQRDVAAAPAGQRLLSASQELHGTYAPSELGRRLERLRGYPVPRGFTGIGGYKIPGTTGNARGDRSTNSPIAYRDDLCAHVLVLGRCLAGPGTAVVSNRTAAALGVGVGDRVRVETAGPRRPLVLTVAGVYRPRDPAEAYWGAGSLLGGTATGAAIPGSQSAGAADAVFVPRETLVGAGAGSVTVTLDLVLQPYALRDQTPAQVARAVLGRYGALQADGYQANSDILTLTNHIIDDQSLILVAVPLVAGQLILLGWYALFLAVTATAAARRPDVGLLKLRGLSGVRIWAVIGGQSAIPVLAGAPVGAVLGWLLARGLAGRIDSAGQTRQALLIAFGAVAVAVLGGVLAAGLAERATMRGRVAELLRRMPSRRRGWRADVVDLALVVLAAAGVYQVHANAHGEVAGLVVLAPGLVALAAGLAAARLLVPVAARAVGGQLRAGRLRGVLTATYLARRSGLDRVFALVVIAATLAGYAACAWDTEREARAQRTAQQVGADRVLTVLADTRTALLAAVRTADPGGRYAMAVARSRSASGEQQTLAVDATRLAAVARWLPQYGLSSVDVARLLHPPVPAPVSVTAAALTLDVSASALGSDPVFVMANLVDPDGRRLFASFGPVRAGHTAYSATAAACASAPGCRLAGFQLSKGVIGGGAASGPPAPGPQLVLHELRAGDAVVLAPARLGDRSRWRATADPRLTGPLLASAPDGLVLRPPPAAGSAEQGFSGRVYVIDAPDALPVLTAGTVATGNLAGVPQLDPFGTAPVPVRLAGRVTALPRLGTAGVLTDLEYADRLTDDGGGADDLQVWLAPGAPAGVLDRLRAAGLAIVGEQRAAEAGAQVDAQGPVVALRFQVVAGALGLLLAAGALVLMATVDRGARAEELTALRGQGLSAADARALALSGYALLAGAGTLVGGLAAIVDRLLTGGSLPLFGDGWAVLAPPPSLRPGALLLGLAATAVVLGAASLAAAHQLMYAVRRGGPGVAR